MAMPMETRPRQGEWSVEAMWRLPETGDRYEVIDGVLYVTPAPRWAHQYAVGDLLVLLAKYLEGTAVGHVLASPADLRLRERTVVQPDLYVMFPMGGRRPRDWAGVRRLMLAVEVLSPSTARCDREEKRRLYQQHADEYWIVDLDARLIERWLPHDVRPEILDAVLTWQPAGAGAPLTLDLPSFFRGVLEG